MKTKFTLLIATALIFTTVANAQNYNDRGYAYNNERNDRRDMNHDRNAIYRDDARINHERHEMNRDEAHGDYRDARYDHYEINRNRRDRFYDRHDLYFDHREFRHYHRYERGCF